MIGSGERNPTIAPLSPNLQIEIPSKLTTHYNIESNPVQIKSRNRVGGTGLEQSSEQGTGRTLICDLKFMLSLMPNSRFDIDKKG